MLSLDDVTVVRSFDRSGQKQVYLVDIDSRDLSSVILKIGRTNSQTSLSRIIREVEIQRSIDSNYFPKNYDFEFNERGEFVILEEYIPAPQLRNCIQSFDTEDKIRAFAIEVITGCTELWNQRVVHRDLKPENILVLEGRPVILDLGIARVLDDLPLTSSRQAAGPCTRKYAAPEQLVNIRQHIDFRTDLFLIGIMMAELFLQRHPYDPETVNTGMSISDNILNNNYTLDYEDRIMSPDLKTVVTKLLQQQPYKRYRDIERCIQELGG